MTPLDKFYTRPDVATRLAGTVLDRWAAAVPRPLFVEPAAGAGAFLAEIERRGHGVRAMDIDPPPSAPSSIIRGDFLSPAANDICKPFDTVVFIGNPPFGADSSIAARFFNRAAGLGAAEISFVLPLTFQAPQLITPRLDPRYRLAASRQLPGDMFVDATGAGRQPWDCVFQTWLPVSGIAGDA